MKLGTTDYRRQDGINIHFYNPGVGRGETHENVPNCPCLGSLHCFTIILINSKTFHPAQMSSWRKFHRCRIYVFFPNSMNVSLGKVRITAYKEKAIRVHGTCTCIQNDSWTGENKFGKMFSKYFIGHMKVTGKPQCKMGLKINIQCTVDMPKAHQL